MPIDPSAISRVLCQSLVAAPPLVGHLPEADQFDCGALEIPEHLAPLNLEQKLGHITEAGLALLLEASLRYELLAQNLQIQKDAHTTIGELDFLIQDLESGERIHLEIATKFYLAVPRASGHDFPGPDARDNYLKKLHRLRSHQLQLSARYQNYFPEAYRNCSIVSRQLIHGCLFDHVYSTELAKAEFIDSNCRRGRWLTIDQVPKHFAVGTRYELIPKPLWPAPLPLLDGMDLEPWSPNAPVDRCLLVRVQGEALPFFIAPNGFPQIP